MVKREYAPVSRRGSAEDRQTEQDNLAAQERARQRREAVAGYAGPTTVSEASEKLKADLDDLLDEIDEVLETNAEDFVKSYVQKGGE